MKIFRRFIIKMIVIITIVFFVHTIYIQVQETPNLTFNSKIEESEAR